MYFCKAEINEGNLYLGFRAHNHAITAKDKNE
jgi:hypothetical protein